LEAGRRDNQPKVFGSSNIELTLTNVDCKSSSIQSAEDLSNMFLMFLSQFAID